MLPVAIALAAVSAFSMTSLSTAVKMPSLDHRSLCGASLDPEFVHFVPPAPASGRNPLFRLISSPPTADGALNPLLAFKSCRQVLTRAPGD